MRGRTLVPWLLTLGLVVATFAFLWQLVVDQERWFNGEALVPPGVDLEPWGTLLPRIQATWESADRGRSLLLVTGVALCLLAGWRAWRVEGLPAATLRLVAGNLAILGAACLLVVLAQSLLHEPEWTCDSYVTVSPDAKAIGYSHAHGTAPRPGAGPLPFALGAAVLGLGALLGFFSLLYAPRAPRRPREATRTP